MTRIGAIVALGLLLHAPVLTAQIRGPGAAPRDTSRAAPRPTRVRPELRLDYLGASTHAVHVGAGVSVPAGVYARVGIAAGAGPGWGAGDGAGPSGRVDLVGRFLVDPFRRARLGVSLGGGVSARYDDDDLRALALLLVDVEGPGRRGWIPFGGVGIGGGVRLTAGVRRAATTGR